MKITKDKCLAVVSPELAAQWHPTKNGSLTPWDVSAHYKQKVWWLLPYDDASTGLHHDFEWQSNVSDRVTKGCQCPYLLGRAVWPGFNDLATVRPDIAVQWHPTKNKDLRPTDVTEKSSKDVWWYLPYDDPETGLHHEFEWVAKVYNMSNGWGCPYLSGRAVWTGFNDLQTRHPAIAAEWHPTKNGSLLPTMVTYGSSQKVWWLLSYDDPNTGKHHDFEWESRVSERAIRGRQCPYLCGQAIWPGFNDLATVRPDLASQWHPMKNSSLKPTDVMAGSDKIVWWYLPYDDPDTGKHHDFEWESNIHGRLRRDTCPFLSKNARAWPGFNDLATTYPEIAAEWNYEKNGTLTPKDVTKCCTKKVWWKTVKNGVLYEWQQQIVSRTSNGSGCPDFKNSRLENTVAKILKDNGYEFAREKKLNQYQLKLRNPLRYDFVVQGHNVFIECDGQQHFEPVDHFGGIEKFERRTQFDNLKNVCATKINARILRIPYVYDPIKDFNKIENIVIDFIERRTIPKEILDFYSQFEFSNYVECVKVHEKMQTEDVA